MLFLLHLMLFFFEIFVILLLTNFKLILYHYCDFLQVIGFITLFQGYQRVHVPYYLSMPIDNVNQQARVGIFNCSKLLFKTDSKNRGMLHFLS